jgi:hypothetical protein
MPDDLRALGALLPPSWGALLLPSAPQVHYEWWEWPAVAGAGGGEEVLHVERGSDVAVAYAVDVDGALVPTRRPSPWPPPADRPAGRPCLVIRAPSRAPCVPAPGGLPAAAPPGGPAGSTVQHSTRLQQQEQEQEREQERQLGQLYVVGPWVGGEEPPVDPTQWGLSGTPLLGSTTRQRTSVLVQRDAAASHASSATGFVCGQPMCPAVWQVGDRDGLALREQRWIAGSAPPSLGRRPREEVQRADPGLMATAPWIRAVRPRLHYAQRVAQRLELEQQEQRTAASAPAPPTARRRRPPPWWRSFDDPDGGMSSAAGLPWAGVWDALHRVPAPRAHRFLAWRLMHAALPCAARVTAWRRPCTRREGEQRCCHHAACAAAAVPETLSHIFLDCPVAREVTAWACNLWAAVTREPPPPRTAAVFLAAQRNAWDARPHHQLWHALRIAVLYFLWANRCRGREDGRGLSAVAVVAQVVHHLRTRIREDAIRAFCRLPDYSVLGGEWLPERPPLTPEGFMARWGHRGVLCAREGLAGPMLVRLTLVYPVPPPRGLALGG